MIYVSDIKHLCPSQREKPLQFMQRLLSAYEHVKHLDALELQYFCANFKSSVPRLAIEQRMYPCDRNTTLYRKSLFCKTQKNSGFQDFRIFPYFANKQREKVRIRYLHIFYLKFNPKWLSLKINRKAQIEKIYRRFLKLDTQDVEEYPYFSNILCVFCSNSRTQTDERGGGLR